MVEAGPTVDDQNLSRLKLQVKQLSILHNIARAVTSTLDLQRVLNRIVDAAVYLTQAEEGFLMLVDDETQMLHLRAGRGLGEKEAKVMRIPVNDSLSGQVLQTGQPLHISDDGGGKFHKVATKYLVKSLLKVPVKNRHQVIGVLSVDHAAKSDRSFSHQDLNLLTILAQYAAVAIDNAQRYEQATQQAEQLGRALKEVEVAVVPPPAPALSPESQQAISQVNADLKSQQAAITQARQESALLAEVLQAKAETAQEIASQLTTWQEQIAGLLPHLEDLTHLPTGNIPNVQAPKPTVISPPYDTSITSLLLSHLNEGVLLCNSNGNIIQASHSTASILGIGETELQTKSLQTLFPDDAHWEHLVGSVRLDLSLDEKETTGSTVNSATFYQGERVIEAIIYAIPHAQNLQEIAIVVILRDGSIESAGWRVRDEMVNDLSEKLRTPLSAVHTYTEMLLNESVGLITSKQRRYLERVRTGVGHMEATLRQFVSVLGDDLSQVTTNNSQLHNAFNLAIHAAREELTLAGVGLVVNLVEPLPAIQASSEFFTQIMTDLLVKAGTHVQQGQEMHLTAQIQAEQGQPSYLVVNIVNPNPRIETKQKIKDNPDLMTITKAVQYHGGRIWIDVDYQGKWRISFLLPIAE